jgi:NAD(P)-dependent dehydrogenase (short-subunit alcohol dehydrogenase family)
MADPHLSGPDLRGKVAIVSGASRGIGRGLALGLAAAGAKVVCSARTTSDRPNDLGLPGTIEETVDAIRAAGGGALAVRCDIGVADDITALVDATTEAYGRLDVLVNNAMAPTRGSFIDTTEAMWDESMRINVRSLFLTAQAVLRPMRDQGAGSIVNISSGAADPYITGMPPGYVTYSVAKAALERFSTALAGELAELGIAVNALRPGAVKTEMTVHELGDDYDWTGWTRPDAVVPAVNFLAAQDGNGVTGRILESTQYGITWP